MIILFAGWSDFKSNKGKVKVGVKCILWRRVSHLPNVIAGAYKVYIRFEIFEAKLYRRVYCVHKGKYFMEFILHMSEYEKESMNLLQKSINWVGRMIENLYFHLVYEYGGVCRSIDCSHVGNHDLLETFLIVWRMIVG